jgi:RNA polymerase sigma-70 factor (ECF subfamily)
LADDQKLWDQIRNGDARAFDDFYRDSAPHLQTFLRQIVGNSQTAEDLVQEIFMQVWQRPNGFQPERGSLRAYIYGIGRKRAADWWRKQKAKTSIEPDQITVSSWEPTSMISDVLSLLPEEQRTLLWLREVEGLSYAELATIIEIPVGTVRSRLFSAREAARKLWQGQCKR